MRDTKKHIREALQTNVPSWDKEEVWQHIEPKLPPRKSKRRIMIWWWIGCLTAVGFLSGLAWQNRTDAEKTGSQRPAEKAPEKSIASDDTTSTNKTAETNSKVVDQYASFDPDHSGSTGKYKKGPLAVKKPTNPISADKNESKQPSLPLSANDHSANLVSNTIVHPGLHDEVRPETAGFVAVNPNQEAEIQSLATPEVPGLPGRLSLLSYALIPHLTPAVHDKKTGVWLVSLESGIADLDKSARVLNPSARNWADQRQRVTSPKESIHAGFRVFRVFPNQIRIGLGMQYQRIQEVVTARDVIQTIREVPSDSAFYYTGSSGTEYFSGNIREIRTTGFSIYSPNVLTRWSVPLEIGYTINAGWFSMTPSAGLLYTIYQQYQGIHPGPDGAFIYKNKEATDALYKTSGQLSWSAALDVRLFAQGSVEAGLGIFYFRDLTSSLRPETQLDERFIQKGIRLRLVKKW